MRRPLFSADPASDEKPAGLLFNIPATPPGGDLIESLAYMRASRVKKFFRDQHFFFSYVSRGLARAQFCIDGTAGPFAWPRRAVKPPEPAGSRRKARGVDGESARPLETSFSWFLSW